MACMAQEPGTCRNLHCAVGADNSFGSVHPMQQSYSACNIIGSGLSNWAMQAEWNDVSNALRAGCPTLLGGRGRSGLDWLGKVNLDYSQIFAGLYESLPGRPRGRFNGLQHSFFQIAIVCTFSSQRRYAQGGIKRYLPSAWVSEKSPGLQQQSMASRLGASLFNRLLLDSDTSHRGSAEVPTARVQDAGAPNLVFLWRK